MSESSTVFWAAFGGAAAAGVVTLIAMFCAEWFRWFLDRPLVRVTVSLGYISGEPWFAKGTQYVFIDASNPHSKPVTLSIFGVDFKEGDKDRYVILATQDVDFPYQLSGGKSVSTRMPTQTLLNELEGLGRLPCDIKHAYFKSSTGKVYTGKLHRKTVQALENAYAELRHQQQDES